jgi:tetratricopeptide (TPR) repeat protein
LLQGKFDDAKKWAKKIVAAEPNDSGAKQLLAAAEAKQLPDALREQIEPATSSASQAEFMQAWQLFNQGRNAEARVLFEKQLAAKPNDPWVMNGLGWALLNSGNYEEAKPHFEKALKIEPNAAGLLNGMARVLKAEGNLDEAIKVWQHMLKVSPGPNAGTFGLADAYVEQGKYQEAVPLLEQLVKLQPENEALKSKLAMAKEKAGS